MRIPELADEFAKRERISRRYADRLVRDFAAMLADLLVEGQEIEIRGLGKFRQSVWSGRNSGLRHVPAELPARRMIKFRPSDSLRQRLKEAGLA
jgi:nucleoid DNA-binding protein